MRVYTDQYEFINSNPLSIALVYVGVLSACLLISVLANIVISAIKGGS